MHPCPESNREIDEHKGCSVSHLTIVYNSSIQFENLACDIKDCRYRDRGIGISEVKPGVDNSTDQS